MKLTADKIAHDADVNKLLKTIEAHKLTKETVTDYHLIAIGYFSGLRVSEIAALKWSDIDLEQQFLTTLGKGNKKRTVWFGIKAVKLLRNYKQQLESLGVNDDDLFIGTRGPLKRNAIHTRFKYWVETARLKNQRLSFHSLRHGAATAMLNRGLQLTDVKSQLGHSNISTTSTYLHFTEESVERIKRLL